MTRVKICGLTNAEDAEFAADCGAHALGFVLEPSSPRFLADPGFVRALRPYVLTVAVFGPAGPMPEVGFEAVQWLGEPASSWPAGLRRIQAVRLRPGDDALQAIAGAQHADAIVLDGYSTAQYGGTGEQVNVDLARVCIDASTRPVILAGGLTPVNVAERISLLRPYGVDVSSGVESRPGKKDPAKVRDFIQASLGV